jgi:Transposase IS116/IS110/IS902 family
MKRVKFVGLDVHAETIAVAVAEQDGEVRSLGVIPNREESIRKLLKKLGPVEQLRFCYEAGPTGYEEAVKSTPAKMRAVIQALQALRGVAQVAAVTIVAEVGEVSRFSRARQLMGYGGITAGEHSSGEGCRRGGITKTRNAHLRRVVVEAAWAYRHGPSLGVALRRRQEISTSSTTT